MSSCNNKDQSKIADTIYTNGKIYTVNGVQPWVEAVAIKDGKFLKVGNSEEVLSAKGKNTQVIDLDGKFAMPGIQENHVHISVAGTEIEKVSKRLQITVDMTPKQIQDALVAYAKENPEGWIRGGQWGLSNFKDGRARKDFLDEVIPDRPVVLINEDFHGAVANSKALELAGITKETPQPATGFLEKNPVTGEPTGFMADGGMFEVIKLTTPPTTEQWSEAIKTSIETLHEFGITAITDAAANRGALEAYKKLSDKNELEMRIDFVIMMNDYMGDVVEPWSILEDRKQFESRLVRANKAKWGADGVPIAETSLLLEPYSNNPDSYGKMTATKKDLQDFVKAMEMGAQLMVHSVADGTARKVLDAIEEARSKSPDNQFPVQLAHALFVHPDDIMRMKELNVLAEISPPMYYWNNTNVATLPALGRLRIEKAHPIKDYLEAGLLVTYGSDWPASCATPDPWRNLEGMITRLNPEGEFTEYGPLGEPIDIETALKIFTFNGAIAMGNIDVTGSIEEGKYADFIVLDRNLFEISPADISEVIVEKTIFEGKVVYERN